MVRNPISLFQYKAIKLDVAIKSLVVLLLAIAILLFLPKKGNFKYNYEQGKPWNYSDLQAPFNYPILKSEAEILLEEANIKATFLPHYTIDTNAQNNASNKFNVLFSQQAKQDSAIDKTWLNKGQIVIKNLYKVGIIDNNTNTTFILVDGAIAEEKQATDYILTTQLTDLVTKAFETNTANKAVVSLVVASLQPNIVYNEAVSQKWLTERLSSITTTKGVVQEKQLIISQGAVIDADKFNLLKSFESAFYDKGLGKQEQRIVSLGYFILVALILALLATYMLFYESETFKNIRVFLFPLVLVGLFLLVVSVIVKHELPLEYAVPLCIIPIVLRAFFQRELALYAHLTAVLIAGFIVPDGFTFVFIQVVAGMVAIFSNRRAQYWSEFFRACFFILIAYFVSYAGIVFIQTGSLKSIEYNVLLWLALNVFLTFLAYPLIPFFERIFGLISDISLVELTDLNNPLLKRLSLEAPGTFQHSLQVANLAEAIVQTIGGNALLTKVGALYHDVGKLNEPLFFIENQRQNENPHERKTPLESAQLIISHINYGVKLAQQHNLPKAVTEFIYTHHGTTRVEYFYRQQLEQTPDIKPDLFTYPGPKPHTKEQAVVMMADSVEAAARSLKEPTAESIDNLVDNIIAYKIKNEQLTNCNVTFKDITDAKYIIKRMLHSIYHVRVAYPEEQIN